MEDNRKIGLLCGGFVILFFVTITVFNWLTIAPPSGSEQLGLLTGILGGILICRYLAVAWNPVTLQPTDSKTSAGRDLNTGCILPIITISSILTTSLLTILFKADFAAFIRGLASIFVIVFGYMMIQGWRHRPRG